MNQKTIGLLFDLWKKPYGKPIVILTGLFILFVIFDYIFLSGNNIHYGSHSINNPVEFNVDETNIPYRIIIFIGNKESKYRLGYEVFTPDGKVILDRQDSISRNKRSFIFTPSQKGVYKLRVRAIYGSGPPSAMVSVYKNNRSIISHRLK